MEPAPRPAEARSGLPAWWWQPWEPPAAAAQASRCDVKSLEGCDEKETKYIEGKRSLDKAPLHGRSHPNPQPSP